MDEKQMIAALTNPQVRGMIRSAVTWGIIVATVFLAICGAICGVATGRM